MIIFSRNKFLRDFLVRANAPVTVENGTTVRNKIEIESEDSGQCNYCNSLALIVMLFNVI